MQITILTVEESWRGSHYFDRGFGGGLQVMGNSVSLRTAQTYVEERSELVIARPNGPVEELAAFLSTIKRRGRRIGVWVGGSTTVADLKMLSKVADFGLTAWTLKAVKSLIEFPVLEVPPACDLPRFKLGLKREEWDVGFIGARTPDKDRLREWVEPVLRATSHRVMGPGWFLSGMQTFDGQPHDLALRSKVCLNIHDNVGVGSPPNQRLFQFIAWGRVQVVDDHPRLREFFSSDEIPSVESPEEYASEVKYALSAKGKGDLVRRLAKARDRAKKEHSFTVRARMFLEWLKRA